MSDQHEKPGAQAPDEGSLSTGQPAEIASRNGQEPESAAGVSAREDSPEPATDTASAAGPDDSSGYDDYGYPAETQTVPASTVTQEPPRPAAGSSSGGSGGPPAAPPEGPGDDEEEGMLRMSFLEHLEELRSRLLRSLFGIGVAFLVSLTFCNQLWRFVSQPAVAALTQLGIKPPKLAIISPMEGFSIIWVKLPILTAIFLASPWVLYQVWAFIAPGLYRRERRWATPFVISTAGLFILGGIFAYFVAFRYGLTFLLGIGLYENVTPVVSISEYFDLFVNVTLGIGLVFELPVLIFFLTLLRIASPQFLLRNSRYAILIIVIVAAIITPTPDVFNLMLFSVPMCLLYFVGLFASYLLMLHREQRRFPWRKLLYPLLVAAAAGGGVLYLAVTKYGYHLVDHWPFLVR